MHTLTVRAYHDSQDPRIVSDRLKLVPSLTISAGQESSFPEMGRIPRSGWFLEFNESLCGGEVDPIHCVRDTLLSRQTEIESLADLGWEFDIVIHPESRSPYITLSAKWLEWAGRAVNAVHIELWSYKMS
jgi:hypothetical protein